MREQGVDLLSLESLLKHVNVDDCVSEIKQNLIDCLRTGLDGDSTCSHVADGLHVMSALIGRLSESGRKSKEEVYFEITEDIVCPLLTIADAGVLRRSWASLINITSQLSSDGACFQKLVSSCYQTMKDNTANSKLSHHSGHQDESVVVMLHVQLLSRLLQKAPLDVAWLQRFQDDLLAEINRAMLLADDKVIGCIMSLLLPIVIGDQLTDDHVTRIWGTILDSFRKYGFSSIMDSPSAMSERPIFLICEIADVFFPATGISSAVLSLLHTADFWNVLQSGFFHDSSLTRKRTVYLLKRLLDVVETQSLEILPKTSSQPLFWWLPSKKQELSDLWMNYILLIETLEEKQVHVIQPLMPRFQLLVEASSCKVVHQTGELTLLHTSWLLCLSQRAASHDNSHVQRWIVQQLLELDFEKCPIFSQGYHHFFCGPLVKMLSVSSLYHRPQDVLLGQCPPIAESVITFFRNVALAVGEEIRADFFHDLLKGILLQMWGGGPLVYVMQGLAHITSVCMIKDYMIPTLRDLILSPLSTLQACFRSAIQYYTMLLVTNCSDLNSVSVASFCNLIACLRSGETWKRGTHFYRQLVTFLSEAGVTSPLWCEDQIKDHLITSIQNYVNSSGKKDAEDDSVELVYQQGLQIIRLLVLAYDCHSTKLVSNPPSPYHLETLLAIPLNTLCSMNSHAYISMSKVCRSLVLFTILMQETDTLKGSSC